MKIIRTYASLSALNTAKPAASFPGEIVQVSSISGQSYMAMSNGVTWRAVTPVYVGTFASFPSASLYPEFSVAIDTGSTPGIGYIVRNNAWAPAQGLTDAEQTSLKGGFVTINSATSITTANRGTYDGKIATMTGNRTITLNSGLGNFSVAVKLSSGTTLTVAASGVTLNDGTTPLTRVQSADQRLVSIFATANDTFEVTGS